MLKKGQVENAGRVGGSTKQRQTGRLLLSRREPLNKIELIQVKFVMV